MKNILNDLNPNTKNQKVLSKVLSFIKNINKKPEDESKILIDINNYHSVKDNKAEPPNLHIEKKFLDYIKLNSKEESLTISSFPEIVMELNKAVSDPNSNFLVFSDIIKKDPSLTLKILKLANSPLYKKSNNVVNLEDAIGLIGLKATKNLILSVVLKASVFKTGYSKKVAKNLWRNAILTAIIAENFAKLQKLNESFLYTLALLHNIGGTIALNLADNFQKENNIQLTENDLVIRIVKKFQPAITQTVLKKWNFKDIYIDAILNKQEEKSESDNVLSKILYFAQTVSNSLLSGELKISEKSELSVFYDETLKKAKLNIFSRTTKIVMNESIKEFELITKLTN